MNLKLAMGYLAQLEAHNDQAWFHEHKGLYEEARQEFEDLVGALLLELKKTDGSLPLVQPRSLTFKLQRDTRFSRDKSPYTPAFRAHIAPRGKLPIPVGYYLMLRPGGRSFLGGGLFADMFKDATQMVRAHIAAHGDEWARIITDPAFQPFRVGGTALRKVPQGFDPDHPQADYLKHKSWYLELPVPDARVVQDGFVDYAAALFLRMRPFNAFLNRALEGFQMPSR